MNYCIFKLNFRTAVHFGNGMLNDSGCTFRADTLFSAMYLEALKIGKADLFKEYVDRRRLCFSDAFPYVGTQYMIPKPMLYVEVADRGDSTVKKKYKKMKYIPVDQLDLYLDGNMSLEENPMNGFGTEHLRIMAAVRREDETLPFYVDTFTFAEENGLYVIVGYGDKEHHQLFRDLLMMVSYSGIGGKRSSGLGRFYIEEDLCTPSFFSRLTQEYDRYMLLSSALPENQELEKTLQDATYLLEKRSGFVMSETYEKEARRKRDLYVFTSGSCFKNQFKGSIVDVSDGRKPSVYRYAVPLFMGV